MKNRLKKLLYISFIILMVTGIHYKVNAGEAAKDITDEKISESNATIIENEEDTMLPDSEAESSSESMAEPCEASEADETEEDENNASDIGSEGAGSEGDISQEQEKPEDGTEETQKNDMEIDTEEVPEEMIPSEEIDLPENVLSFQVPEDLNFIMDPLEICGRGQIFSKEFLFSNLGNEKIRIELSAIECTMAENVRIADEGEDIAQLTEKVFWLQLLMETGEVITVSEEAVGYELVLNPGQNFTFCIIGNMSVNPEIPWQAQDVSISLVYSVEQVEDAASL